MKEMLAEIKRAIDCKLYYSALFLTVAIPDICSALQSQNNRTKGEKYRNWFNKYMPKLSPNKYGENGQLTAEHLWAIRCSLFHQGITSDERDYVRLLFLEPDTNGYKSLQSIHCCIVGANTNEKSLLINIHQFCNDMIQGTEEWTKDVEGNEFYNKNLSKLIKRYPNGIAPVIGTPVIG